MPPMGSSSRSASARSARPWTTLGLSGRKVAHGRDELRDIEWLLVEDHGADLAGHRFAEWLTADRDDRHLQGALALFPCPHEARGVEHGQTHVEHDDIGMSRG